MFGLVLTTLVFVALSYFMCGIPFGLLIAKASGVDVRKEGSGNIGTTNVARAVGAKASLCTLALDALKGTICVVCARLLIPRICAIDPALFSRGASYQWVLSLVALACICGHVFSPYLRFKGGKGIAVGLGAILGLDWALALMLLGSFLVFAILTRYVSLGSIVAAALLPIGSYLRGYSLSALLPVVGIAVIVIFAHRENIKKLLSGTENKFSVKHKSETDKA